MTSQVPVQPSTDDATVRLELEEVPITLFGHDPTPARLELRARSRAWRLRRLLPPLLATLVVAPLVALLPPHAPWAVGALVVGGALAWRRWSERYTVRAFSGTCPRCGADLELPSDTRLRFPHPLECPRCRHEPILEVDPDRLGGRAGS